MLLQISTINCGQDGNNCIFASTAAVRQVYNIIVVKGLPVYESLAILSNVKNI
jgi:hypothetical protein